MTRTRWLLTIPWLAACLPELVTEADTGTGELALDLAGAGPSDAGETPASGEGGPGSEGGGWSTSSGSSSSDSGSGSGAPPSSTTSGSSSGDGSSSTGGEGGDMRAAVLRIAEVAMDPDGKDGAAGSPEWIEAVAIEGGRIAGLTLQARGWPTVTTTELGLDGVELAAGTVVLIERYESAADVPPTGPGGAGDPVRAAFSGGTGLRNADGAVLIAGTDGTPIDAVLYGAAQPAPFSDPRAWTGAPVPAPEGGRTLCRLDWHVDADRADDFAACTPTPGTVADDGGTTGEGSGSTSEVGGEAGTGSGSTGSGAETSTSHGTTTEPPGTASASTTGAEETTAGSADTTTGSHDGSGSSDEGSSDEGSSDEGSTGGPSEGPRIAIVEVLSNAPGPSAEERDLEYVDVVNLGEVPVDLGGYVIADDPAPGAPGTDPLAHLAGDGGCLPSTCLAPGRRARLVGEAYRGDGGGHLLLATDDSTLADAGLTTSEPVVLRDAGGELASSYRMWPDPKAEPYPIATEVAIARIDPAGPDVAENWAYVPGP